MTDIPFINLENVNNLTKEDLEEIAKNCQHSEKIIDLSSLKSAKKILREEETKVKLIAEAIRDRAIELGVTPFYDEEFDENDLDAQLCYNLHDFMKDVGSEIRLEYGIDYDCNGYENEFWVRSTC